MFLLYRPLVDHWRIFDNSGAAPLCVAEERDRTLQVHVTETFDITRLLALPWLEKLEMLDRLRDRHLWLRKTTARATAPTKRA